MRNERDYLALLDDFNLTDTTPIDKLLDVLCEVPHARAHESLEGILCSLALAMEINKELVLELEASGREPSIATGQKLGLLYGIEAPGGLERLANTAGLDLEVASLALLFMSSVLGDLE